MMTTTPEREDEIINEAMKIILKRHKDSISTDLLLNYVKRNMQYAYKETEYETEEGSEKITEKLDITEEIFDDFQKQVIHDKRITKYLYATIMDDLNSDCEPDNIFIIADREYISFELYSEFRDRTTTITYHIPEKYVIMLSNCIKKNKKIIKYDDFDLRV